MKDASVIDGQLMKYKGIMFVLLMTVQKATGKSSSKQVNQGKSAQDSQAVLYCFLYLPFF